MFIRQLRALNFKNYSNINLPEFSAGLNALVGQNGMGKTNVLDAIHYLCLCKSRFVNTDKDLVKHGEDFFRLDATFEKKGETIQITAKIPLSGRKKKEFLNNQVPYTRLSEHIGLLPLVMIAPDDTDLVSEGSETRRNFLDSTLSQTNPQYLAQLIRYNKTLDQRNAALKQFAERQKFDALLLETYNAALIPAGNYLHQTRLAFTEAFTPYFQEYYAAISGERERVKISYESKLHTTDFDTLLKQSVDKDRILERTTAGIHRDDLSFSMNEHTLKTFASQGQLKSFVIALRLAQYEYLRGITGVSPLLLLDDIFDKLDEQRVTQLLQLLQAKSFGQTFLTDTHPDRTARVTNAWGEDCRIFKVDNGVIQYSITN